MDTIMGVFYEKRELSIKCTVDVLVLGSGPAGFSAAVAAARNGMKTMLVEQQGTVGGIATAGYMSHWAGHSSSKIYDEILNRSADINENLGPCHFKGEVTKLINPEKLKLVMFEMLEEAGVILQLYTFASDVIMDDNQIKGVIIESKSGRQVVMAKVIIDGTGDGDIAQKSGAEFYIGRETDGAMQPATIMFKVGGVNYEKAAFPGSFETTWQTEKGELQALARKHLKPPIGHVLLYKSTLPGIVTCNMTNLIGIDGTKAEDLTKAEVTMRKQIEEIVAFLREFAPGYEQCFVIGTASLIGIRETRHFKGMYTLTEQDILEAKLFDDWVLKYAMFNFDIHNIKGPGLDEHGVQHEFKQTNGYSIPIGCLIPVKIDNLLLSGRNISGTHVAHSNFRVMPICAGIGEAAGTIASIAVKNNIMVRNVKASDVQKLL